MEEKTRGGRWCYRRGILGEAKDGREMGRADPAILACSCSPKPAAASALRTRRVGSKEE